MFNRIKFGTGPQDTLWLINELISSPPSLNSSNIRRIISQQNFDGATLRRAKEPLSIHNQ